MRRDFVLGLAVLALAGCDAPTIPSSQATSASTPTSFAAVTTTDNERFLIDQPVFVDCANGGAGEFVILQGSLHTLFHTTFSQSGLVMIKTQSQPQGVSGVGQVTGTKYQGTGVTQDIFTARIGNEETFVNNFRVIGQGKGNNFTVHEDLHLTVNPNGTLTASFDNLRAECK
jgi:hypothetical protein